jgi:hypothetical protein
VHDEILYREGMAQGLGRDDPVIRRRVLQKYEIISEETGPDTTPTDADLAAYLNTHRADFERPATVTFDQVLLEAPGSGAEAERAFEAARRALARGGDPATLGLATLLPHRLEAASLDRVAGDFGPVFAKGLTEARIGQWTGPLSSSYGVHLVRVTGRTPPSQPPLDAVRGVVVREWEADRRRRALAASYAKLRSTYKVAVKARLTPQLASRQ